MITQSMLPERWSLLSAEETEKFNAELAFELPKTHELYGLSLTTVARLKGRDDFLYMRESASGDCYIVHLTWSKETLTDLPWSTHFSSFQDFSYNWQRIWD